MQLGEVREVGIEVISNLGEAFLIEDSKFEITTARGTFINKGVPTVEHHKIITLFDANEVGSYVVIFTYHIGPETLKAKISVEVR